MKPSDSLLRNSRSIGIVLFITLCSLKAVGQYNGTRSTSGFLDTQFWLGLKLGANVTQVSPKTRMSGFSPINYSSDSLKKTYDQFSLPGFQVGLEMTGYHNGFSLTFQPSYKKTRFQYTSQLAWEGATSGNRFETTYDVKQNLDLIELPLSVKYDLIRRGSLRPFVMIGGVYSMIASAQKEITVTQIDFSSNAPLTTSGGSAIIGVKEAFKGFFGVSGGAGINVDYWNIRTVLQASYNYSLTEVTRKNVRQDEFASIGDTNDEILLRDINLSLSFIFPFRFIDNQLKSR